MTNRRDFLRRCALLAAGTVAADQLDILGRLTHSKVFTTGGYETWNYGLIDIINFNSYHETYTHLPNGGYRRVRTIGGHEFIDSQENRRFPLHMVR